MHEVSINGCDSLMGDTALSAASASGQNGSCLVLIRRGASISCANLKESFPLHMATRQGHWGVADTLLKEGADPNQLDGGQRTALMIAALEGHLVRLMMIYYRQCQNTSLQQNIAIIQFYPSGTLRIAYFSRSKVRPRRPRRPFSSKLGLSQRPKPNGNFTNQTRL